MSKKKRKRKKCSGEKVSSVLGVKIRKLMEEMCAAREGVSFRQVCIEAGLGKNFLYGAGGMTIGAVEKFFSVVEPTDRERSRFLDMLVSKR